MSQMADENSNTGLSSTVLQVINQFTAVMRADEGIDDSAIDQLEKLLLQSGVPKPDDIYATIFASSQDDET